MLYINIEKSEKRKTAGETFDLKWEKSYNCSVIETNEARRTGGGISAV